MVKSNSKTPILEEKAVMKAPPRIDAAITAAKQMPGMCKVVNFKSNIREYSTNRNGRMALKHTSPNGFAFTFCNIGFTVEPWFALRICSSVAGYWVARVALSNGLQAVICRHLSIEIF